MWRINVGWIWHVSYRIVSYRCISKLVSMYKQGNEGAVGVDHLRFGVSKKINMYM